MTQPDKVKILWVHDEFEGPLNGLAEYHGDKVWFNRSMISPTDHSSCRLYTLLKLEENTLKMVEENHVKYCNETGAPLNHGDPLKIRRKQYISKVDLSKFATEINPKDNSFDATQRVLTSVNVFNHTFNSQGIFGHYTATIKETDFSNYFVPHQIEI